MQLQIVGEFPFTNQALANTLYPLSSPQRANSAHPGPASDRLPVGSSFSPRSPDSGYYINRVTEIFPSPSQSQVPVSEKILLALEKLNNKLDRVARVVGEAASKNKVEEALCQLAAARSSTDSVDGENDIDEDVESQPTGTGDYGKDEVPEQSRSASVSSSSSTSSSGPHRARSSSESTLSDAESESAPIRTPSLVEQLSARRISSASSSNSTPKKRGRPPGRSLGPRKQSRSIN